MQTQTKPTATIFYSLQENYEDLSEILSFYVTSIQTFLFIKFTSLAKHLENFMNVNFNAFEKLPSYIFIIFSYFDTTTKYSKLMIQIWKLRIKIKTLSTFYGNVFCILNNEAAEV